MLGRAAGRGRTHTRSIQHRAASLDLASVISHHSRSLGLVCVLGSYNLSYFSHSILVIVIRFVVIPPNPVQCGGMIGPAMGQ